MSTRKKYSAEFKAKVALEALSNQKTIAQLSSEYGVHQTAIDRWKRELKANASKIFSGAMANSEEQQIKQQKELYEKIGQLTMERDFLAQAYRTK